MEKFSLRKLYVEGRKEKSVKVFLHKVVERKINLKIMIECGWRGVKLEQKNKFEFF